MGREASDSLVAERHTRPTTGAIHEEGDMSRVQWGEPALLNAGLCARPPVDEASGDVDHRADSTRGRSGQFVRSRAEARGHGELNPVPLGLAAVAGGELAAGLRLLGRSWRLGEPPSEAAAIRVVHAAALAASTRRTDWRLPLISCVLALRLFGLLASLGKSRAGVGPRRRSAVLALSLLGLFQLRRQAARAAAWDAPLAR
jgi:hypothetical protein